MPSVLTSIGATSYLTGVEASEEWNGGFPLPLQYVQSFSIRTKFEGLCKMPYVWYCKLLVNLRNVRRMGWNPIESYKVETGVSAKVVCSV
jgi:hypothetical protein